MTTRSTPTPHRDPATRARARVAAPALAAAAAWVAFTAPPAHAQARPAAGLWEVRSSIQGGGGEMQRAMEQAQKQMASMPPEQRRAMEQMMARQGVQMGAPGQPAAVKVCVTPEMAARSELPPTDARCRFSQQGGTGGTLKFRFECPASTAEPASSGEGEYRFTGDKASEGRMTMNITRDGKAEKMEIRSQSRWLAADCGAIKPLK